MGGSVGVGDAFGRTGTGLGFSAGTTGFVSCAEALCSTQKITAQRTMNLRKSME
jgi:hypothetical protein